MWSLLFLAILAAATGAFNFTKIKPTEPTKPCDDFYESVCEEWNNEHDKLDGAKRQIAVEIEDILASSVELLHHEEQARVLFDSCMNWDAVMRNPSESLLMMMREMYRMNEDLCSWPVLDDADEALFDFNRLVKAVSQHYESWPFFSITSGIDQEQNNNTLIFIDSPTPFFRELVRKNSTEYKLKLSLYAKLWAQAAGRPLNDGALAKEVEWVAQLEEDIAEILRPMAETVTSALATNNKFRVSQLRELFPLVDWSDILLFLTPAYLDDYIRNDPEVIVTDPEYIRELDSVLARYDERTHFNYAWWQHVVDKLMRPTPEFAGTSTEVCVDFISQTLPEAVDSLYLNRVRPLDDIDDSVVDSVFGDVQAAMLAVLDEASWLDERSRERAQQKLTLNPKEAFVMHTRRIAAWHHSRRMALTGRTVEILDAVENSAILLNYMYLQSSNAIVAFPGMLQHDDIHNPSSSEALYGSLGSSLGHEMLHAFDKEGICYGPDGNALELLERATKEVFEEKLQCVEKRYSSRYMPGSTQFVDGKRTLSENVADIDGLKIALKAHDLHRRREGLQRSNKTEFFKAFARSVCENMTPEAAQLLYAHDEHAPWKVRVNEALRNNNDFSKSFACPEESGMSSADKCYVWSEKPRVEDRTENGVNRIAESCITVMTAVLLAVLKYY